MPNTKYSDILYYIYSKNLWISKQHFYMKPFYVIVFDFNSKKFEKYDIMETLVNSYKREKDKPTDIAEYVKNLARYLWWAKCEYEVILSDWPCQKNSEKWDVYGQVMMNFDLIVKIFTENVENLLINKKSKKKTDNNLK